MQFTDRYLKSLKGEGKTVDIREARGFGIRVFPSGEKTFFFRYQFEGKKKYLNLGRYPDVSLKDARDEHSKAGKLLEKGIDPIQAREDDAAQRRQMPTIEELYKEYMSRHSRPNKKERTWKEDERNFGKDILPYWKNRKADSITRRDVTILIDRILDRGALIAANNTFERVRQLFNFAVERGTLEHTPCYKMKAPTPKIPRDRHLTESEIRSFWSNLDKAGMTEEIRRALKLTLVTGQRPGEVIGLSSLEINDRWWTIPAERSKNGKPHTIYLTDFALELIGEKKGFIFESARTVKPIDENGPARAKPMDENALARAVRNNCPNNLDAPPEEQVTNKLGIDFFRPHDLRRTCATNLAALGFTDEVIDAVLNHVKKGVIRTYNLHRYDREKQLALETWERKLRVIVEGKTDKNNVIPITQKVVNAEGN
jgi:integrase